MKTWIVAWTLLMVAGWALAQPPGGFPEGIAVTGEVIHYQEFQDEGGRHFLIVSNVRHEIEMRTDLYGYEYVRAAPGADVELVWDIKDFSPSLCHISLLPMTEIIDLDRDGHMETFFAYQFLCDGLDPTRIKFMLHTRGTKLALRGSVPVDEGMGQPEFALDPALDGQARVFSNYLKYNWNALVEGTTDEYFREPFLQLQDGWVMAFEYQYASGGTHYELFDKEFRPTPLPKDISESFRFAQSIRALDNGRSFIFNSYKLTGIWDFREKTFHKIVQLYAGTEAVSEMVWSPSGKKMAFISYNPSRYDSGSQIFVFTLDGYKVVKKEKFPVEAFTMAASVTVVSPPTFQSETSLSYTTRNPEDYTPGPEKTIFLTP